MVVDVGGESTARQLLLAVRPEGVVAVVGFLDGKERKKDSGELAE